MPRPPDGGWLAGLSGVHDAKKGKVGQECEGWYLTGRVRLKNVELPNAIFVLGLLWGLGL